MRIVVNTRLLLQGKLEGIGWFAHETLSRITRDHPEHQFVFLFDRPFDRRFLYAPNVQGEVMLPPTRHPLLYRLWFGQLLHRRLKALKADAFISPDGFLALRSNVPALAVVHDLNFEHHPEDLPAAYSAYYRRYFPLFARHAVRIATVSEFSRRDIASRYHVPLGHIDVVHNGVHDGFVPLTPERVQAVRQELAGGHPYFISVGSLHPRKNIARMLLAFDRMLTDHPNPLRLVVVGERFWWDERMRDAWDQVRHKDRVVFTGRLPQERLVGAVGAAQALVFTSYFEGFGIPVAEAMRCGVPVIAAEATSLPEVAGDAALYVDPFSVADIARAMREMHEDEALRERLSEVGLRRARRYTWDRTAEGLWASFLRMCADAGLRP
jgi:glycosyltransferase involved in cell wall biosynthesis